MLELGCLYEEKRFAWFTVIDLESQDHDNSERLLVFWSLSLFLILSLPLSVSLSPSVCLSPSPSLSVCLIPSFPLTPEEQNFPYRKWQAQLWESEVMTTWQVMKLWQLEVMISYDNLMSLKKKKKPTPEQGGQLSLQSSCLAKDLSLIPRTSTTTMGMVACSWNHRNTCSWMCKNTCVYTHKLTGVGGGGWGGFQKTGNPFENFSPIDLKTTH